EKQQKEMLEREKAEKEKAEKERREIAEADKRKKQEAQQAALREKLRQEQLQRIQGALGGTGAPSATGTAARDAGPSASYAGRIKGRIKPNIVFTDEIQSLPGNPVAEVELRVAPDGTILGRRIIKSSGVDAWDETVLRAVDRTGVLPRDTDGRVPPTMVIAFRPKD
ncbi:MAG: cell envelope integrity protein TolA, partial [Pseudomonadota bacterium]